MNQACYVMLNNNYYMYSVNMFIWIDNGKYITAKSKCLYVFSLFR